MTVLSRLATRGVASAEAVEGVAKYSYPGCCAGTGMQCSVGSVGGPRGCTTRAGATRLSRSGLPQQLRLLAAVHGAIFEGSPRL